ncbi:MAG: DNA adenine methylase [Candidatus Promineifilaceae bacterium]
MGAAKAKPFLKWAGGKRQLLRQIERYFPTTLKNGVIERYVEPFVGSGAVFLHVVQNYPVKEFFIADINLELILAYRTVQRDVQNLMIELARLEERYLPLTETKRKEFYYRLRAAYNAERRQIDYAVYEASWIRRTAQLIFLNRTCYNGLFRVNSRGEFNVPFGRYANPTICDRRNLLAVSHILQHATVHGGHYTDCAAVIDDRTLVYFDPPYRPLSATANFTAYSAHEFDDRSQLELAEFFKQLDGRGAYLLLSNSDPRSVDPEDDFLEVAYRSFPIERVQARRRINSRASKRGPISELLIRNYAVAQAQTD